MLTAEKIKAMNCRELRSLRLGAGLSLRDVATSLDRQVCVEVVMGWELGLQNVAEDHLVNLVSLYQYQAYSDVIGYTIAEYNESGIHDLFELRERAVTFVNGTLKINRRMIRSWLKHFLDITVPNDYQAIKNFFIQDVAPGDVRTSREVSEELGFGTVEAACVLLTMYRKGILERKKLKNPGRYSYWLAEHEVA